MCILVAVVILVFKPYDYGASLTQIRKIRGLDDESDDGRQPAPWADDLAQ